MNQGCIMLKICSSRKKLLVSFPNDPKGDISIVFKTKKFTLQRAFLRLESEYFKTMCKPSVNIIIIKQNFEQEFFEKIMSCFYGATIKAQRFDLINYYPIIKFLGIESMLAFYKKDIMQNIQDYDIFTVMKIAHQLSDQGLFQLCLQQLQQQSFEQLEYNQYQLIQTQLPIFKLIIKTHNQYRIRENNGLPFIQIASIINDYCQHWDLGKSKYNQLKFQLLDKTLLSSDEYKRIFLDDDSSKIKKSINMSKTNSFGDTMPLIRTTNLLVKSSDAKVRQRSPFLEQSPISQIFQIKTNSSPHIQIDQRRSQMEITFQKKRNQQLSKQNKYLTEQLQSISTKLYKNQDTLTQMEQQVQKLINQLKKKDEQESQFFRMIEKYQIAIRNIQKQLQNRSQSIDRLADQIQKLKNRKPAIEQEVEDVLVHSQFLPAHLIGDIMSKAKQNYENSKPKEIPKSINSSIMKLQESLDEEQLQALYLPRLAFDEQPVSCLKFHLPRLAEFLNSDGFNKKNLKLIYRRSPQQKKIGKKKDIREKNSLLVILQTCCEQIIGGFISIKLSQFSTDYMQDSNACIFSLSKNQKFPIKKYEQTQAIFLSDQYLLSFSNDLMIANDCLNQQSYSSWPCSYEGTKSSQKQKRSSWLTGTNKTSQFRVKSIDIYQVTEDHMEMIID